MTAAENLEAFMKMESELRAEYEVKLSAQTEVTSEAKKKQEELQAVIDVQAAELASLANATNDIKRLTQESREAGNRVTKAQAETDTQKSRTKLVRKELMEVKSELKVLKALDPEKLKKNIKAGKKRIEEEKTSNGLLEKSIKQFKETNYELKKKNEELEAELVELRPAEEESEETEATEEIVAEKTEEEAA